MAKRFFYVCAGLLCLALSYHLGARNATAQGGLLEVGAVDDVGDETYITGAAGRTVYWFDANNNRTEGQALPPVPGTSPVLATGATGNHVVLENGDIYSRDFGAPSGWVFRGNLVGSPTPAASESMGSLKARYRGPVDQGVKPSTNR
jgi:hypothetical protein